MSRDFGGLDMLKIKDNVDLKELEKFGFIFIDHEDLWYSYYYHQVNDMTVAYSDRIIATDIIPINEISNINTLYDLIKADLVEKVGD